jgi:hypothetical protein
MRIEETDETLVRDNSRNFVPEEPNSRNFIPEIPNSRNYVPEVPNSRNCVPDEAILMFAVSVLQTKVCSLN